jgi:hypothetical protein
VGHGPLRVQRPAARTRSGRPGEEYSGRSRRWRCPWRGGIGGATAAFPLLSEPRTAERIAPPLVLVLVASVGKAEVLAALTADDRGLSEHRLADPNRAQAFAFGLDVVRRLGSAHRPA